MKSYFQAKDIQNILGISKTRYGYLISQIGIQPDIEEGRGTGYTNLYSVRNLLQIAFAHYALDLISVKVTRKMLDFINKSADKAAPGLYEVHSSNCKLHYIRGDEHSYYFKIEGAGKGTLYYDPADLKGEPKEALEKLYNAKKAMKLVPFIDLCLDLGVIKHHVLMQAAKSG